MWLRTVSLIGVQKTAFAALRTAKPRSSEISMRSPVFSMNHALLLLMLSECGLSGTSSRGHLRLKRSGSWLVLPAHPSCTLSFLGGAINVISRIHCLDYIKQNHISAVM